MITKEEILKGRAENLFLASCYLNPVIFFTDLLGFEARDFHKDWISILRNYDKIAISAPTGFGKTTVFGVFWPLWTAFFKKNSLSLVIAKSIRTQSSNILEEIKIIIDNNEILKQLRPEKFESTWTKEKIFMTNGSRIQYSSNSINVRGIQADYEFADEVATYDNQEVFFRDILTRIVSKKGKIAAVSTPVNTNDLLARIINTKGFYSKIYPALVNKEGKADLKGESIWPEKFPKDYLLKTRESIGISNFERNYMCNPKAESSESPVYPLIFVEDCYDLSRSFTSKSEGGITYIGCDFALSSGPRADFDCYVVVEVFNNFVIIKHIERHKGIPMPSKIMRIKDLTEIYKPVRVIIDESNIGNEVLRELVTKGVPVFPQSFQSNARKKLLLQLKNILENKLLVIPRKNEGDSTLTVTMTDVLTEELIGFKEEESRLTRIKHLVSSAAHDDTVMALAMACSGFITKREFEDCIGTEDEMKPELEMLGESEEKENFEGFFK
jgi:hypothetical protein